MIMIILMIYMIYAQVITNDFSTSFTSAKNSYRIKAKPSDSIFKNKNELFLRDKCSTCCRVVMVSDYNFNKKQLFESNDEDQRFAMDMEFDDISGTRNAETNYEQTILLRPLNMDNILQQFELYSYKMINSFFIPHRVHDIRSGIKKGNKLIIWQKKPPLDVSTNNQRFVYIHPYLLGLYVCLCKYYIINHRF